MYFMSMIKVLFIYVCGIKHRRGPEVILNLCEGSYSHTVFEVVSILRIFYMVNSDQIVYAFYADVYFYNPVATGFFPNQSDFTNRRIVLDL